VNSFILWLGQGLGSGRIKPAPGTWGTLAGALIWWAIEPALSIEAEIAMVIVASFVGIYLCGRSAELLNVHDDGSIVWDEFAGIWLTYLMLQPGDNLWLWVAGFVLFRIFDILKPWPIRWIDRSVGGGIGIMLDDLIAGLMAGAVGLLIIYLIL